MVTSTIAGVRTTEPLLWEPLPDPVSDVTGERARHPLGLIVKAYRVDGLHGAFWSVVTSTELTETAESWAAGCADSLDEAKVFASDSADQAAAYYAAAGSSALV